MSELNSWHAREAQTQDIAGLKALFDAAGGGCFCQWWHFEGDDYAWQQRCAQDSGLNREALDKAWPTICSRDSPRRETAGIVATDSNGAVIGWLKLCLAPTVPKIYARRLYRTLDCFADKRDHTWVIACMLTHPEHRRHGVARSLVEASIEVARELGAQQLEALARAPEEPIQDAVLAMGPANMMQELGFVQIAGPDSYPVLRISF